MRISVTTCQSNKFKMTSILLYIIEIMIVYIAFSESEEVCCEYEDIRFRVGETIFPEGKCVRLTCADDGFYHMYGCPIRVSQLCYQFAHSLDRAVFHEQCCMCNKPEDVEDGILDDGHCKIDIAHGKVDDDRGNDEDREEESNQNTIQDDSTAGSNSNNTRSYYYIVTTILTITFIFNIIVC